MSGPFLFVSHVSEDRAPAAELVDELERRGVKCWIAPRDVRPGKPYDDEIAEAIDDCAAMLLIFSERCNESHYIRRETTVAGEAQKLIIPFRIEDAQPKKGLRMRLADLHWIDGFIAREQAIDAIIRSVEKDPRRAATPASPQASTAAPTAAPPPARTEAPVAQPPTSASSTPSPPAPSSPPAGAATAAPALQPVNEDKLPAWVKAHLRGSEAGEPEHQYVVGVMHRYGNHLPADLVKAMLLFRLAGAKGHAGADHQIGLMFRDGHGLAEDTTQAAEWFGRATKKGHSGALIDLGRLYEQGDGVPRDKENAASLYRDAVARGAFWAQRLVDRLAGANPDWTPPDATERAALMADELTLPPFGGMERLALGLTFSRAGVAIFPDDLADVIRRAKAGDAKAQYVIGYKYQVGDKDEKAPAEDEKARAWYRLSAAQNFGEAHHRLGILYKNGLGVERDPREAALWFERAAAEGVPHAFPELGRQYETGEGVEADPGKALLLYEEGVARGSSVGQYEVDLFRSLAAPSPPSRLQ